MQFQTMPFILLIMVPAVNIVYLSGGLECSASENRIDFSHEQNWALHENEKIPESINSLMAELPSDTWWQGKGIQPF